MPNFFFPGCWSFIASIATTCNSSPLNISLAKQGGLFILCWPSIAYLLLDIVKKNCTEADTYPYNGTHFCSCSSHCNLSFFFFVIPLDFANSCHLVKGLGFGTGFALGITVFGSGNLTIIASSALSVGSSQILLRSNCVLSRVRDCKYVSLLFLKLCNF